MVTRYAQVSIVDYEMRIKNIESFLQELNADPRSVISRLQDITEKSIEGVLEQKISPRSEIPVECLVYDLRTAVAAQKIIWDIAVYLTEINQEETEAAQCTLVFADFQPTARGDNGSQT